MRQLQFFYACHVLGYSWKSLTRSGALMCDEHWDKISFKSNKSTYAINHLNRGNTCKNKTRVLGAERFPHFLHFIKVVVNIAVPPSNGTQVLNLLRSLVTKQSIKRILKNIYCSVPEKHFTFTQEYHLAQQGD